MYSLPSSIIGRQISKTPFLLQLISSHIELNTNGVLKLIVYRFHSPYSCVNVWLKRIFVAENFLHLQHHDISSSTSFTVRIQILATCVIFLLMPFISNLIPLQVVAVAPAADILQNLLPPTPFSCIVTGYLLLRSV